MFGLRCIVSLYFFHPTKTYLIPTHHSTSPIGFTLFLILKLLEVIIHCQCTVLSNIAMTDYSHCRSTAELKPSPYHSPRGHWSIAFTIGQTKLQHYLCLFHSNACCLLWFDSHSDIFNPKIHVGVVHSNITSEAAGEKGTRPRAFNIDVQNLVM